jgi:uncharacterized protein YqcC (DUF446 family)
MKLIIEENGALASDLAQLKAYYEERLDNQESTYKTKIAELKEDKDGLEETLHTLYARVETDEK